MDFNKAFLFGLLFSNIPLLSMFRIPEKEPKQKQQVMLQIDAPEVLQDKAQMGKLILYLAALQAGGQQRAVSRNDIVNMAKQMYPQAPIVQEWINDYFKDNPDFGPAPNLSE